MAEAAVETGKDTAAGLLSAVSQTVVGYPFNTVKVRMQVTKGQFSSPLHCAADLLRDEGLVGMYRGVMPMLFGQQLANIALFGTYQRARRLLDNEYAFVGGSGQTVGKAWTIPIAGCLAGIANSFILCPVELVAVRLQIQNMAHTGDTIISRTNYKGPIDCLRQIVAHEGITRVFTGIGPTMAREAVGVTCWFSAYELARWSAYQRSGGKPIPGWQTALCGTAGGVAFWSVAFPLDTAKSRLQAQGKSSVNTYKGVADCLRRVHKEEGMRALYQGYSAAVVRAGFVGAAVFWTYEVVRGALG
eukprot:TRINITY_DN16170_c0_g1_i2.p1 TRINITY_DN16170_c0_g1~~TRINITY_DN16170_c0_g1_i2.p1  ORF type:complete len:302 (-),score=60.84 TRINITY_DN16170_c0_g1_i2:243-1148(-)